MSEKVIQLSKSVYELCQQYPELPQILHDLGFTDITRPGMLVSVGRFMTLVKGAAAKKIDIEVLKQQLEEQGFVVNN
jgi:hypothetical protein